MDYEKEIQEIKKKISGFNATYKEDQKASFPPDDYMKEIVECLKNDYKKTKDTYVGFSREFETFLKLFVNYVNSS